MGVKFNGAGGSIKGRFGVLKNTISSNFEAELLALEPRILFDGAAVVTGAEAIDAADGADSPVANLDVDNSKDIDLFDALSGIGPVEEQRTEIAFVDTSVEDYQSILAAIGDNVEVVLIDNTGDGVEQIASVLRDRTDIDGIHIISHGRSGTLDLGTAKLTEASMAGKYADEMAVIAQAMDEAGDILIYGCNFGQFARGAGAVDALAAATGADVAASNDLTGAAELGGDWDLEVQSGTIETGGIEALAFASTLDLTITDVGTVGANGLAQAILGDGVTINSATYSGTNNQAGTFVTGAGASFGNNILTFTEGAIFSSGTAQSIAGPNNATNFTVDAPGGIDGDAEFNALAGGATFDASFIEIDFTPDVPAGASAGDTGRMTMEIVFGSDEYNEFVYGGVNDTLAVIVNGVNQATVPNGLAIGIDTINDAATFNPGFGNVANDPNPEHTSAAFESANPSLYVNNDGGAFNTQLDGFTITIPVTFDVIVGQSNTIKIGIADTADAAFDSWMFVKADSGQTVIVAENDAVSTPTNVPVTIDVTANDFDLQGDPLAITHILGQAVVVGDVITLASGVTVTVGAGGDLTVEGDGTNTANDAFTYAITDGNGGTSTAFVNVTMTAPAVNNAPVAGDDTGTANEDTVLSVNAATGLIDSNDTDADGDTLVVSEVNGVAGNVGSQFALGSGALLTVNADGSYDYDPNGAFESLAVGATATETFTYTVNDGNGGTDTATVTVTINGANDAPVAVADTGNANENTVLSVNAASGVISSNDTDPDGDALVISTVNGAAGGVGNQVTLGSGALLTLNADGSYDFDPNGQFENLAAGATATDTFTYTVSDSNGGTDTATVTVTTTGSNDAPILDNDGDDSAGVVAGGYQATYTENGAAAGIVDSDVSITDVDSDLITEATITLTNGQIGDVLNIGPMPGGLAAIAVPNPPGPLLAAGSISITILGNGSRADYEAALQAITFQSNSENPNESDRTINIQVAENADLSNSTTTTIHVVAVNDNPVLDLDGDNSSGINSGNYQTTFTENGAAVVIADVDNIIQDLDDTNIESATITLTNPQAADVLAAGAMPAGIVANVAGNVVTLTGSALIADYITAIQAVTFENTSENPDETTRQIAVVVNDGQANSNSTTAFVDVVAVNDAPVLTVALSDQSSTDGNTAFSVLTAGNFNDVDGDTLTFSLGAGAPVWLTIDSATGVVSVAGSIPADASQNTNIGGGPAGTYDISVIATDPDLEFAQDTFRISIANLVPVAVDDASSATEDTGQAGNVITDALTGDADSAPDSDTLSVSGVSGGVVGTAQGLTNGDLTVNSDGSWSFAPNATANALAAGETATETVTYTIDDGNGGTDTATLTLTLTGVNDGPTAVDDTGGTDEDTVVSVVAPAGLIDSNDTDPDASDTLTVSQVNGNAADVGNQVALASGALLTVNGDGSYDYDPNGAFEGLAVGETGTETFTYTISDGNGGTDTASVTLTVNGVNDAPTAVADANSTDEDTALNIAAAAGLIDPNDTDPDATDTLSVSQVNGNGADVGNQITLASGALLTVNADGSYDYDPNGAFEGLAVGETGTETFNYTVSDGNGGTDTASVTLTLNGLNDAPTAVADTAATDEDTVIIVTAAAGLIDSNDTDPDASDTLTVSQVNGNAGDVGNQITLPSGALLTVNADGSYDYDPNAVFENLAVGETGTDSFTYTVSDGNGGTDTASVTLTINGVNDAPVAADDTAATDEDTVLSANAAAGLIDLNDTDPDTTDTLNVSQVNGIAGDVGNQITLASGALLTVNPDGSYDYDPNGQFESLGAGETGTDTFTYTVSDGNGGTDTASVTLTISGINDAPTAGDDTGSTDEDTAISIAAVAGLIDPNDTDPDVNDTLTVSEVNGVPGDVGNQITLPSGALLTVNPDGSYDYDPNGVFEDLAVGETGTDSFTYTVDDGNGGSDTATLTLTVNGVNDAPTAVDDAAVLDEDNVLGVAAAGGLIDVNDTDPDASDTLAVSAVNGAAGDVGNQITLASGALLRVNSDGSYSYDPNGQFESLAVGATATDSFTYTIDDGNGGTDTATATLTINGVNDAPVVVDPNNPGTPPADPQNIIPDVSTNDGETPATIGATDFIVDPDGDPLTFTATDLPPGLSIDPATGEITGTLEPSASQAGSDPVNAPGVYEVVLTGTDPSGATVTTTITYTIENLAPVAADDVATVDENTLLTGGNVITGAGGVDTDTLPDGDGLVVSEVAGDDGNVGTPVAGLSGGLFTINQNGSYSFDPNGDFESLAPGESRDTSIEYQISDGEGGFDTAVLTVTVTGVNDAPVTAGPVIQTTVDDGETIAPLDVSGSFNNPNGDPLIYSASDLPPGLSIDPATGIITGTVDPDASLPGTYTTLVTATTPTGETATSSVIWSVNNVDPVAGDDAAATALDTPVTINVAANDVDGAPDSDPLTVTATTSPANGTVVISPDGTLAYTPDAGFTGTDTFTYTIDDGQGGTDTASVTVSVGVANPDVPTSTTIAPLAFDDGEVITPIDVTGSFGVPNGATLTYTATGLPKGLELDPATGVISGTIDNDASEDGPYTVQITASDPVGNQVTEPLTIVVSNPAPTAGDDSANTAADTPVTIVVLGNDSDPDGDALDVALINVQPANGTVTINPDGTLEYTPDAGFTGTDTFTYVLEDANGGRDEATVSINVGIVDPDTPTVTPLAPETVDEGSPITPVDVSGSFTDPNGDPLTYTATGLPEGLEIDPATGIISGTPVNNASEDGPYTVLVTGSDPDGNQVSTPLVINVSNPAPAANDDVASTQPDAPVVIAVLANDNDPDGDLLGVTGTTLPANGSVVVNPDGTVTYTPDAGFTGSDTFDYIITDAQGATSTATITIEVTDTPTTIGANDNIPPVAATDGETPATIGATDFIVDPEGDLLTFSATELPPGLSIDPVTGDITGTLEPSASQGGPNNDGVYDVTLTGTDPLGATVTTTVTYTISNLPPVAVDDASTADEDGNQSGNVITDPITGDADGGPDTDPLSVSAVTGGIVGTPQTLTHGDLTINADGSWSFTPNDTANGLVVGETVTETVTYTVDDGNGGTDTATLTIELTGSNDTPIIVDPNNPGTPPTDPQNVIPDVAATDGGTPTAINVDDFMNDPDGDPLTFSAVGLPLGLTIDPVSGEITGVVNPDASQGGPNLDGVYSVTLTGTDPSGDTITTTVTYTISNLPPVAVDDASTADEDGNQSGNVITDPVTGDADAGPDTDPLSVSAVTGGIVGTPQTLTHGDLTINADGSWSFTPNDTANGLAVGETVTETVTYTVDDGNGGTDTAMLIIELTGSNDTPVIVDPNNPGTPPADPQNVIPDVAGTDNETPASVNVGDFFADPDGDPLIFSASNLPPGLIIDPVTGDITGTIDPSASQGGNGGPGVYNVTLTGTDPSGDTVTTTVTYTIVNAVPTVVALGDENAIDGDVVLLATGGNFTDPDGDVLTFSANGLPPGLAIDPVTGEISGTIAPFASNGGPYTVIVTADDGEGGIVSSQFIYSVGSAALPGQPVSDVGHGPQPGGDGGQGGGDGGSPVGQPIISKTVDTIDDLLNGPDFGFGNDQTITELVRWIGQQGKGWMSELIDDYGYDVFAGQDLTMAVTFDGRGGDGQETKLKLSTLIVDNVMFVELGTSTGDANFLNRLEILAADGQPPADYMVKIDAGSLAINIPAGSEWIELRLRAQLEGGLSEFWDVKINILSGEILPGEHGGGEQARLLFKEQLQNFANGRASEIDKLISALNG